MNHKTLLRRWAAHRRIELDRSATRHERAAHATKRQQIERALRALGITDPAAELRSGEYPGSGGGWLVNLSRTFQEVASSAPVASTLAAASAMLGIDTPEGLDAAVRHATASVINGGKLDGATAAQAVSDLAWLPTCGVTAALEEGSPGSLRLVFHGSSDAVRRLLNNPDLLAALVRRSPPTAPTP